MKKLALILLLCLPMFALTPIAAFAVAQGGACTTPDDCDGTLTCLNGTCQPGEQQVGGTCTSNDQCAGDETCSGGKCVAAGNSGTNTSGGSTQVGDGQPFVPLTDIPVFANFNPSAGLPTALNSLYVICIGIAVVIAVLQLARAGITYMLADSLTSKEEARHLIGASILGLILVLSPYLVFSLINPKILSLNINVSNLTVNVNGSGNGTDTQNQGTNTGTGQSTQVSAPTNLQTTAKTSTSASLSWSPPSGTTPSSYQVLDGSTVVSKTSATSVQLTGLTPGSTHQYAVESVDSSGLPSAPSNVDTVTVENTQTDQNGTQGQWVASSFVFVADDGFHAPPVNCWNFGATGTPVPYENKTKDQLQQACNSSQTENDQNRKDFQCVFVAPGATFTAPAAPGQVCHPYTCTTPYDPANWNTWRPCTIH